MEHDPRDREAEWDKTRDIENSLSPWVAKYKGELNLNDGENFHDRPPLEIVIHKFRAAKITAYVAAVLFTLLFVCIWPVSMLSIDILDLSGFKVWTTRSKVWAFVAASFILVVPMYQEVKAVLKQLAKNKEDKKAGEEMQPLYKNGLNSNGLPKHTFTAFQSTNKTVFNFKAVLKQFAKNVEEKQAGEEKHQHYKNCFNNAGLPSHTLTAFHSTDKTGLVNMLTRVIRISKPTQQAPPGFIEKNIK